MIRNMRIGQRLAVGFGFMIALLMVLAGISYLRMESLNKEMETLVQVRYANTVAANRIKGVRCAVVWSEECARLARLHNDANVISIGQRLLSEPLVLSMIDIWLTTGFEGGRHVARIAKLDR